MRYQVLKLEQPKKLCVICGNPPESCKQDKHILDTIGFNWVLVDKNTNRPISFHFAQEDATKALMSLQKTNG